MVHVLWTEEEEEKENGKTVEIKEEKVAVKVEVPDTDVQRLKLDPPRIERDVGDGTNYEKAVKEEPARTPSGFVPWYSGSESRRSDRPGLGWSWSRSREVESFPGQQSVGGVASSKVLSGSTADKTDACLFWNAFEANTEGLPDQSRLLVFSQKLKGREAERWWGNSSIRDFRTLKLRFHNHFLRQTADEPWERLQTTKRERGESIEEWGDRVSELCDSLDYPDARMRYQQFRRGLRNKRCLATLDSSPACDIPEATEWLIVKDIHRPIEEDDEFVGDAKAPNAVASNQAAIDALSLKMNAILQAQSQQQTQNGFYQPRSPRNRSPRVDVLVNSVGYRLEEYVWEPISVLMTESLSVGDAIFLDALEKCAGASA
ncbi:hypothetical protein PHMEG_00014329 [Phytophthora megakarya]|uniref:Retrotransposon gag domain-containing protein n=1 Tax=Phytophthora megakarya TaxID=4795 RepID=A0A225W4K2_9STRA|nr:hypothetical protein PHMEG_00014329 [Phytophthora megakarya]